MTWEFTPKRGATFSENLSRSEPLCMNVGHELLCVRRKFIESSIQTGFGNQQPPRKLVRFLFDGVFPAA
jgi:hypothetical protein